MFICRLAVIVGRARLMNDKEKLTRDKIVKTLSDALKPVPYIHAFWEGGAASFDRIDEWSDIDLYLVVDDDKVETAFCKVAQVLETLSHIKQKYDVPQTGWPGVFQAFYSLEGVSEYLIVDLAVLQMSSPSMFLEPEIHGKNVFYFNKNDKVKPAPFDGSKFAEKVHARLERLEARFNMFNNFVQKEINRHNYLEAIDLYYVIVLGSIVEVLRVTHNPLHFDFKMRYVHRELPDEVVERLRHLFFVKNEKDLQQKYKDACGWFRKISAELDWEEIEETIRNG
jgi:hypothetical protein